MSVHLSLVAFYLYSRPSPSCIISASFSFFFSFRKTVFSVFVLICVHECVSVTYNPSCLFFPDTSVRLPWQRASAWDGWTDGETERKRVENVSVIKLLPLSLSLSSKRAHLSLLVPPFPSAQLSNHVIPLFLITLSFEPDALFLFFSHSLLLSFLTFNMWQTETNELL